MRDADFIAARVLAYQIRSAGLQLTGTIRANYGSVRLAGER